MLQEKKGLNVLIIDDEKEACINLRSILTEFIDPGLHIAGMANSTAEAQRMIAALKPDAVFLDIEMPNENAFRFLERIWPVDFEVVFVTAYDEYAVRAFKLNAIDYILKPINIKELADAVRKLEEKLRLKKALSEPNPAFPEFLGQAASRAKQQKIILKDNNNVDVIEFVNILFVEAQGSYSKIVYRKNGEKREIIMSTAIAEYEELLPANQFCRIHRSYLLNCAHVKKILKDDAIYVQVNYDCSLPVSRRRYTALLDFLKNNNYHHE